MPGGKPGWISGIRYDPALPGVISEHGAQSKPWIAPCLDKTKKEILNSIEYILLSTI